jgi:hypothetical protein
MLRIINRLLLFAALLSLVAAIGGQPDLVAAAQTTTWPGVSISLNCTSSQERIRVINDSQVPLVVKSISTLADPEPDEPFVVTNRIAAGGTRQWQAGPEAKGSHVLTRNEILSNVAGDNEGVRVETSAGSYIARCPKAPSLTGEKWIEVDLGDQYLTAWQGDYPIAEKIVNTGKPGFDTPQGTYFINLKFDHEDMNSCSGNECWNIPRVPWVMYFTGNGHAFHGVYWYDDFGSPRSHGCVNLPEKFAQWLYEWAPLGTRVWIHE